jgi:hypothetical protein
MPVYQGTYYSRVFQLTHKSTGHAIDITGWDFGAEVRQAVSDDDPELTLTSLDSPSPAHFVILDGPNGRLEMRLYEDDTEALPEGTHIFDVLRIDVSSGLGPQWLFGGSFVVKKPVTRGRDFE